MGLRPLIKLATGFQCSVDELLAGVDPDYDRALEGVAAGVPAAATWSEMAVASEGDALPDDIARDEYGQERPEVLGWCPARRALATRAPTGSRSAATR